MISAIFFAIMSAVIARPPLENMNYDHNVSLIYDGEKLMNLDSINSMDGVDSNMANSLKKAITDMLPSYVAGMHHHDHIAMDESHSDEVLFKRNAMEVRSFLEFCPTGLWEES
ncbi:unnamed protein product [Strongylus vulgaris]|uniref:Uncharacterized protein n=1 Tax=Strongylus vulgaris TaxID=40348 RepID=A0A3P7JVV6_STRVU|nr:unnamed protein product [Strongylus vulgaris]